MAAGPVNRNAPCPCGSGKKYKQCCLRLRGAASPAASAPARVADDVKAKLNAAQAAYRAGDLDRVVALFRAVLEVRPKDRAALLGLGEVLGQIGRPVEGIPFLERAIAAGHRGASTYALLAEVQLAARRRDAAIASAERCLALDAGNLTALRTLAVAHEFLGDFDAALKAAQRAVRAHPGHADSAIILGRIERRRGDLDASRAVLEPLAATLPDAADPGAQCRLFHELGITLDKAGEYERAYDAFARSGAAQRRTPAARRIDFDDAPGVVARFRAGITPALLERARADGAGADDVPVPAFLVGFPRSGTTMTEQIMAAHPGVATAGEVEIIPAVLDELRRIGGGTGDETRDLAALDADQRAHLRRHYWEAAHRLADEPFGTGRFVDKLPLNLIYAGLINVLFPTAPVIVALRDPRDVCLSCVMQHFEPNSAMVHLTCMPDAARFYAQVMGLWLHQRAMLTLPWIEVRYEDTVSDLESQARRILDHLGVAWHDDVLAFHEKARSRDIWTPSYAAVREPVHTKAVARWKRYEASIEPEVFTTLAPFVEAFGYGEG